MNHDDARAMKISLSVLTMKIGTIRFNGGRTERLGGVASVKLESLQGQQGCQCMFVYTVGYTKLFSKHTNTLSPQCAPVFIVWLQTIHVLLVFEYSFISYCWKFPTLLTRIKLLLQVKVKSATCVWCFGCHVPFNCSALSSKSVLATELGQIFAPKQTRNRK